MDQFSYSFQQFQTNFLNSIIQLKGINPNPTTNQQSFQQLFVALQDSLMKMNSMVWILTKLFQLNPTNDQEMLEKCLFLIQSSLHISFSNKNQSISIWDLSSHDILLLNLPSKISNLIFHFQSLMCELMSTIFSNHFLSYNTQNIISNLSTLSQLASSNISPFILCLKDVVFSLLIKSTVSNSQLSNQSIVKKASSSCLSQIGHSFVKFYSTLNINKTPSDKEKSRNLGFDHENFQKYVSHLINSQLDYLVDKIHSLLQSSSSSLFLSSISTFQESFETLHNNHFIQQSLPHVISTIFSHSLSTQEGNQERSATALSYLKDVIHSTLLHIDQLYLFHSSLSLTSPHNNPFLSYSLVIKQLTINLLPNQNQNQSDEEKVDKESHPIHKEKDTTNRFDYWKEQTIYQLLEFDRMVFKTELDDSDEEEEKEDYDDQTTDQEEEDETNSAKPNPLSSLLLEIISRSRQLINFPLFILQTHKNNNNPPNFQFSITNSKVVILSLETMGMCLMGLGNQKYVLLPTMHKIWSSLVELIKDCSYEILKDSISSSRNRSQTSHNHLKNSSSKYSSIFSNSNFSSFSKLQEKSSYFHSQTQRRLKLEDNCGINRLTNNSSQYLISDNPSSTNLSLSNQGERGGRTEVFSTFNSILDLLIIMIHLNGDFLKLKIDEDMMIFLEVLRMK